MKVIKLINLLKLNLEIESKFNNITNDEYIENKIKNIQTLTVKLGISLEWKAKITKYLVI